MKAFIISAILLTVPAWLHSQNSTIPLSLSPITNDDIAKLNLKTLESRWIDGHWIVAPSEYFDSLLYETRKGRECTKLVMSIEQEYNWIDSIRQKQDEEISIYLDVIESQNKIIVDYPKELKAKEQAWDAEKSKLKAKNHRLFGWLVGLVGVDAAVILLAILLL